MLIPQLYPVFIAGQYSKNDVAKLITVLNMYQRPETQNPHRLNLNGKQKKTERNQIPNKILSLSSSVTKVREYTISDVENIHHISICKPDKVWVSDWYS